MKSFQIVFGVALLVIIVFAFSYPNDKWAANSPCAQTYNISLGDSILKLHNAVPIPLAKQYQEQYMNLFSTVGGLGYVKNYGIDSFPISTQKIGFFKNMADNQHLFKDSSAQVIWAMLGLDTVASDSNLKQIKLYIAVQNNFSSGTLYYDVSTKSSDGNPILMSTQTAQNNIIDYNNYFKKFVTAKYYRGNSVYDTSEFCLINVGGFEVNYTDLKELAKLPVRNVYAVLTLKPCCEQPKLFTIDMYFKCTISMNSYTKIKTSQSLSQSDSTQAYLDFTLPCPNNCPQ